MEKRRPTYDLGAIKTAIGSVRTLAMTRSAIEQSNLLGFDTAMIAAAIQSIDRSMFFKSMTTYADHSVWQDVYHIPVGTLTLYVKFQADLITEFRVISFKEK